MCKLCDVHEAQGIIFSMTTDAIVMLGELKEAGKLDTAQQERYTRMLAALGMDGSADTPSGEPPVAVVVVDIGNNDAVTEAITAAKKRHH